MRAARDGWIAAVVLVVLVTTIGACGGAARGEPEDAARPSATSADTGDRTSRAELEAIYEARLDSARMRFSEADVDFMTGMIAHHAQALIMARMAPTHGASPSIRTLAARIISAQKDEIATMERWLRERGQPVPQVEIEGGHAAHDAAHTHMPGMLTPEQLEELDRARGAEFDRLFLEYMIQHHDGAVTMVHDLFATDGAAQGDKTFRLASDIQVDQATEIARMEIMLSRLADDSGR